MYIKSIKVTEYLLHKWHSTSVCAFLFITHQFRGFFDCVFELKSREKTDKMVWLQSEVVIATLSLFSFYIIVEWRAEVTFCACVWRVGTCCAVGEWWVRQDDRLAQGASKMATEHAWIWGEVSVLQPAKRKHTGTLRKRWFKEGTNRSSALDIPLNLEEVNKM